MRRMGWFAAWPAGLALGAATARLARNDPAYAYAGSGVEVAIELLAGYAMIASGLIWIRRHPHGPFGMLLIAGGCGWFLLEWNNPSVGSPLVFTVGLVLYAAAPPVLAYALITYPANAPRVLGHAVISLAFAGSVLALGLLPALVFEPGAQGCSQCPRNLLLVRGSATLYRQFNRVGVYVGLAWTVLVLALLVARVARASFAVRRRLVPVLIPGCAYLALVAADFVASVHRGYLSNDPIDRGLWLGEAAALTLVALAPGWSWLSARRTRAKLARLVVELSNAPSPGGLEQALAAHATRCRNRRHQDATHPHRRRHRRRPADPHLAPRDRRIGPVALPRLSLRAAPHGPTPRWRRLPAQGTRLGPRAADRQTPRTSARTIRTCSPNGTRATAGVAS